MTSGDAANEARRAASDGVGKAFWRAGGFCVWHEEALREGEDHAHWGQHKAAAGEG